ncbi:hypothetical protein LTS18_005213 [Coniosporium uncinatum]|uniref:Uncharacterized protein n=1 Tax=Coniosporium uncinatum TaxID=93489 RepID=A0ACC3DRJ8_9PEZI|nr:hypothetical protein LTS18_005213 [Coniosporium uncinatum]
MPFIPAIKRFARRILTCCEPKESPARGRVIGEPYNFRLMEINIEGLTEEHQTSIRDKAAEDANSMTPSSQPVIPPPDFLSISGNSDDKISTLASPTGTSNHDLQSTRCQHSRNISAKLAGYHPVPLHPGSEDGNEEERGSEMWIGAGTMDAGAGAIMMQDLSGKEMRLEKTDFVGSRDSLTLAGSEGVESDKEGVGMRVGRK